MQEQIYQLDIRLCEDLLGTGVLTALKPRKGRGLRFRIVSSVTAVLTIDEITIKLSSVSGNISGNDCWVYKRHA